MSITASSLKVRSIVLGVTILATGILHAQDTLQVNWAGSLAGSEIGSFEVTAGCDLQGFDISLGIVAPGSNWAGDMALAITAPNGNRIEVGGYNTDFLGQHASGVVKALLGE